MAQSYSGFSPVGNMPFQVSDLNDVMQAGRTPSMPGLRTDRTHVGFQASSLPYLRRLQVWVYPLVISVPGSPGSGLHMYDTQTTD